ncbi:uncharacterized protein [Dermacentor albipictus]|uniref:uncharacterized protein isoform X1 n=1 Tax=Dermacentor albipictus TaxID=60249 RepID=UPI0038FC1E52
MLLCPRNLERSESAFSTLGWRRGEASFQPRSSPHLCQVPGRGLVLSTPSRRSLGGAGTRQDVRVVIDSDQMTPTGTAVSKRNALASCDQQPRATEVKARDPQACLCQKTQMTMVHMTTAHRGQPRHKCRFKYRCHRRRTLYSLHELCFKEAVRCANP